MGLCNLIRKTEKVISGEEGFTLVELLIVMIVSLIMLAGMIGLLEMGFKSFTSGRNLQSITDASRRALPAMDRQIKSLLHINDQECIDNYKVASPDGVWNGMSFYSNVSNNALGATAETYTNAEKVEFYLNGDDLMQKTTTPGSPPVVGNPTSLCSYVTSFRVYYFSPGLVSATDTPPNNRLTGTNLNSGAGSVKIVITMTRGAITRTFQQTTFLRVLQRD